MEAKMRIHEPMVRGLEELVDYLPGPTRMIEVGVFVGESTQVFAKSDKITDILCVDSFAFDYKSIEWAATAPLGEDVYETFKKNILDVYPKVKLFKKDSILASLEIEDESVDMVYIDANHVEEFVEKDLRAWLPKVKRGGYIAGHDWNESVDAGGVIKAFKKVFDCEPDRIFQDTSFILRVG